MIPVNMVFARIAPAMCSVGWLKKIPGKFIQMPVNYNNKSTLPDVNDAR